MSRWPSILLTHLVFTFSEIKAQFQNIGTFQNMGTLMFSELMWKK